MRLYHPLEAEQSRQDFRRWAWPSLAILILISLLTACAAPKVTLPQITVSVTADEEEVVVQLPAGSTAGQALEGGGIKLGEMDRVEPPAYTVLSDGAQVRVVRVTEEFEVEQVVIPFQRQTLRNESLPEEKEVLLQKGENGLREVTYRRLYEDGVEVSKDPVPVKAITVREPLPEIIMVGIQAPFFPVAIPGRIVYLRDGSAWMIETSTGNRRVVVSTGDLDGRIFSLSTDSSWLLFSRRSDEGDEINGLWAVDLNAEDTQPVDLKVRNVVHFADWVPGATDRILFSTVEPRQAAPGWQANNDLNVLSFSPNGWTSKWASALEANTGGVYGWWGMDFQWSPDGQRLAYTRPDSIGMVDLKAGVITSTLQILPLQTGRDWAWAPGLAWSPDGEFLYTVEHVAHEGSTAPEESPIFDLTAAPLGSGEVVRLVSQAGMFAYPLASPPQPLASEEISYEIAYLQAEAPTGSETSRYRIYLMDRDGSNRRPLFPPEGSTGMLPQNDWGAWSPASLPERQKFALAVVYEGNLWIVDQGGDAAQVTGDGLTSRVIWR